MDQWPFPTGPNGTTAKPIVAAAIAIIGASRYSGLVTYAGTTSSFNSILAPSARGWSRPKGMPNSRPARFGPIRSWA